MDHRKIALRSLYIKNFLSHEDTRIDFGEGIQVFSGENGAGKSSIVDAVYYSLSQPNKLRGNKKTNLVRRGSQTAIIEAVFQDVSNGDKIEVRSVIGSRSEAYLKINGKLVSTGVSEVRNRLRKELFPVGLDPERLLSDTSIVRQGGLSRIIEILSGTASRERLEYFQKLLGLKEYKEAADRLREYEVSIASGKHIIGPYYPNERSIKLLNKELIEKPRELSKLSSEINSLYRSLKEIENRLELLKKRRENLFAEKKGLEEKLNELRKMEGERNVLLKDINELTRNLNELNNKVLSLKEKLHTMNLPSNLSDFYNNVLVPYIERRVKLESIRKELGYLKQQITELNEAIKSRENAEKYEKTKNLLESLIEEKNNLLQEITRLKTVISNALQIEKEIDNFIKKLRESGLKSERIEDARTEIINVINDTHQRLSKAEAVKEELDKTLGVLNARIDDLINRLEMMQKDESSKCPLCGHELGESKKKQIIHGIKEEIEELRRKTREITSKRKEIVKEIDILKALMEKYKALEKEMQILASKKPKEPVSLLSKNLEEYVSRLGELDEEIGNKKRTLLDLESDWQRYNVLSRKYKGDIEKYLEEASRKHAYLKKSEEEVGKDLDVLKSEIEDYCLKWNLPCEPDSLVKEIRELLKLEMTKNRMQTELNELQNKIEELKKNIEMKKERLKVIEEKLETAKSLRDKLEGIERELKSIEDTVISLEKEKSRIQGKLEKMEEERKELSKIIEELRQLRRDLVLLYKIRKLYEDLPSKILRETMNKLESEMSDVISKFNLSYTGVKIDSDTLEFMVLDPVGREVSISQLSGGEQTAIAIAYVIALNKVLGGVTGFLILDEPTTHLDPSRRKSLVEVLERAVESLTGINQLIIITHHEEVKDSADILCEVTKENGVSKVVCEGLI